MNSPFFTAPTQLISVGGNLAASPQYRPASPAGIVVSRILISCASA
jgi:hypothetical protein